MCIKTNVTDQKVSHFASGCCPQTHKAKNLLELLDGKSMYRQRSGFSTALPRKHCVWWRQESSRNICEGGVFGSRWVACTSQMCETPAEVPDRGCQAYPCTKEASFLNGFKGSWTSSLAPVYYLLLQKNGSFRSHSVWKGQWLTSMVCWYQAIPSVCFWASISTLSLFNPVIDM